jgi:UDP-4-amino-4,6-dideoxy-N-acetyl-beta-L-altrosamine transaminase
MSARVIPYGRHNISEDDIQAVVDVLHSDFITQGSMVPAFEQRIATYCGVKYAVAVCNATSGLHLACRAIGLGQGDRLWTVPNTFVASANCGAYCGATVDFVDIDPRTYTMSVAALEEKLTHAEYTGTLPKVVVPVHFAGQSCDMNAIARLAKRYGFYVIEDASHAIGADYQAGKVGKCRYADMTVFSFHPVKIITTGEGGMVTTNDVTLYERLALLRTHGVTRDSERVEGELEGDWAYQQVDLGYNYRLTDIQAALGLSQMTRLDAFVTRRRALVAHYHETLVEAEVRCPWQHPDTNPSWHLYVIRVAADIRKRLFDVMRNKGVGVHVHYTPVHMQPYYLQQGFVAGDFPEAEQYAKEALTLPLYPDLSEEELEYVVDIVRREI